MPKKRDFSQYFQAINETAQPEKPVRKSYKIENVFKPTFVDNKTVVVMRFLPSHPDEFKPYVENRSHMYQYEEGKYFGCDCLEKFGQPCPICDYNKRLYTKFNKEEARPLRLPTAKRRYISNVYIVKNENAPETEGNVYRYEYGTQIMDIIRNAMQGHDDPDTDQHIDGFNPFDWHMGANFVYEAVMGSKGPNLDKCRFGSVKGPLRDKSKHEFTDSELDEIEAKLYTLDDCEHKPEEVKSYEEIVFNFKAKTGKPLFGIFDDVVVQTKDTMNKTESIDKVQIDVSPVSESVSESGSTDEVDEDEFFASLNQ